MPGDVHVLRCKSATSTLGSYPSRSFCIGWTSGSGRRPILPAKHRTCHGSGIEALSSLVKPAPVIRTASKVLALSVLE